MIRWVAARHLHTREVIRDVQSVKCILKNQGPAAHVAAYLLGQEEGHGKHIDTLNCRKQWATDNCMQTVNFGSKD
jgi:hypothetical protein